jgi:glutamine synthetase
MAEMQGAADILMVPDPSTFRILPWAPDTGWFLCDLRFPDGRPVPFSTRGLFRRAAEKLASAGYEFVAGLEVEFHAFKIRDPRLQPADAGQPGTPPEVELLTTGYQLLTEHKYDQLDPVIELLRRISSSLTFRCARSRSSSARASSRSPSHRAPVSPPRTR